LKSNSCMTYFWYFSYFF